MIKFVSLQYDMVINGISSNNTEFSEIFVLENYRCNLHKNKLINI